MNDVKANVQENEEVYKEYHAASALMKDDQLRSKEGEFLQNPKNLGELMAKNTSHQRKGSTKKKSKP